jgi:cell division protein FtsA
VFKNAYPTNAGLVEIPTEYEGESKIIELSTVSEILRFRAEEIFDLFADEIYEFRLKPSMPAGLVLTGGGSLLKGIRDLAEEKLDLPVRVGIPLAAPQQQFAIPDLLKSPIYSTAYGLLLFSLGERSKPYSNAHDQTMLVNIFRRMKSWIYDIF